MREQDDPVNVDENGGAAWLQDEGYRRRELKAHELAERLHIEREKRAERRRRSSWQGAEDFEE